ncbi:sirohydrochlorin chelatase [filamentous cyanobacterium LEGE 11480]|uniref:Sirohydrochlorin chelatase n=1 Tax=Romeriopsis navalis LEGE 11480 TaxID=2777977 RepID=A0A928VS96_9CYAN|nr:sirohydrochlorin chelatase [Romeriopsis navalis]MBE9031259.1 sirohydrochlorin chelatase [Romeriopsis navalis LEGE 11480]
MVASQRGFVALDKCLMLAALVDPVRVILHFIEVKRILNQAVAGAATAQVSSPKGTVGYLLVLHGSSADRYQAAVTELSAVLSTRLGPTVNYRLAYLECAETSLSQQIQAFGQQLAAASINQMQILPLFLLPGVHVMEDIPTQVHQAQQALTQLAVPIELVMQPYLGSQPQLHDRLQQVVGPASATAARILVAHGTKRPGGNQPIETLAETIQFIPAYWFVAPSLSDQVTALFERGVRQVVVLPYVLLAGSLTDGIARQIDELQLQFPSMQFDRLPALDQSGVLIELIVTLCHHASLAHRTD